MVSRLYIDWKATREPIAEGDDPVAEPALDPIDRPKDLTSLIVNRMFL